MSRSQPLRLDLAGVYTQPYGLARGATAEVAGALHGIRQRWAKNVAAFPPGTSASAPSDLASRAALLLALPHRLIQAYELRRQQSELHRALQAARAMADEADRLVVLGGSHQQQTIAALFAACCHPRHNQLSAGERGGAPRLHFFPNESDHDALWGMLDLLSDRPSARREDRWAVCVSSLGRDAAPASGSESGPELNPVQNAWRQVQPRLRTACLRDQDFARRVVAVARPGDWLHQACMELPPEQVFVVGSEDEPQREWAHLLNLATLLPLAAVGADVVTLLRAAAEWNDRFLHAPPGANAALDLAAACHLLGREHASPVRLICPGEQALAAVADWYASLGHELGSFAAESSMAGAAESSIGLPSMLATTMRDGWQPRIAGPWQFIGLRSLQPRRAMPGQRNEAAARSPSLRERLAAAGQPLLEIQLSQLNEGSVAPLLQCLTLALLAECQLGAET